MNKPSVVREVYGRKSLSVVLAVIFFLSILSMGVASGQAQRSDLAVARYLIDVAARQYKQGAYTEAENTLLEAQSYQQSLSESERAKLTTLLNNAHTAAMSRKKAVQMLQVAQALAEQDLLQEARPKLEQIKDSPYLTSEERKLVNDLLQSSPPVNTEMPVTPTSPPSSGPVTDMNSESMGGNRSRLLERVSGAMNQDGDVSSDTSGSYIDRIKQNQRLVRSHVQAVMKDTKVKVQQYQDALRFDLALNEIDKTRLLVESNKLHLGNDLVRIYTADLNQLAAEVAQASQDQAFKAEQTKRETLLKEQKQLTQQEEIEKQKTIIELMARAKYFKTQQRYEAALSQVEGVLAKDPQHNEALILESELKDIILLRRQRDLDKESERQRIETLMKTKESSIPYADELTYAKNWDDINKKETRRPDLPGVLEEQDAFIYEQLDTIVDLSALSPEMPEWI